jgi:tetratricopeptide (TPR) repeat protein
MKIYPPGTRIDHCEIAGRPMMGGMGIVYICNDLEQDRPVALKTFKPKFLPDRAARDRFLREGTAWVDLGAHPHVVRCHEVLKTPVGDEVYLVLELVAREQGREDASLRAWLTPGQPLAVEQALLFALQIARGMQHATATISGFVHRDLKPENVLVGADRLPGTEPSQPGANRLRVTDFGLAAVLEAGSGEYGAGGDEASGEALRNTQLTHGIVGTPLYMAPEQWRGERVSVATDVYALGCMLQEMAAGQRAAPGRSLTALQRAHCQGDLRPLPDRLPDEVRTLLTRCLALEPGERYGGWEQVEEALVSAYEGMAGRPTPAAAAAVDLSRAERVQAGWSYNAMGASYLDIGKAETAAGYFERAQEAGQAEGDRQLEGAALGNLGSAYLQLGDARRAIGFYEQALEILREIGDRRGEGNALGNLGVAYADLGDARRAIDFYEQCLTIHREIGDRRGEGNALGNLGNAYADLGDARRAIGFYEQALEILREIGDRRGEGADLGNLGLAYADLGDARRAIGYYEQALEISREIGDRRGEGKDLGNLGIAYKNLGDARRAIQYHEQALAVAREIGDRRGEGNALVGLGNAYLQLGDARRAIGFYEQYLEIACEIGDRHGEGNALGNLGLAYARLGDARRAIGYYEEAIVIRREIGDLSGVAIDSYNMANLYRQQGEIERAIPLAQEAARIWVQIGSPYAQRAQQLVAQLQGG